MPRSRSLYVLLSLLVMTVIAFQPWSRFGDDDLTIAGIEDGATPPPAGSVAPTGDETPGQGGIDPPTVAGGGVIGDATQPGTGIPVAPRPRATATRPAVTASPSEEILESSGGTSASSGQDGRSAEGWVVSGRTGDVVGPQGAAVRRYTVEVEPGVEASGASASIASLETAVAAALGDEVRSWSKTIAFQQVADTRAASIRIVLATPDTVDLHCGRAGIVTAGELSCWDGSRVLLNASRWARGAASFGQDIAGYRTHLVNHEVGHALGRSHAGCSGDGPAPIMMQQTNGVGTCTPNPWPFPS